jgi:hypothetical protein
MNDAQQYIFVRSNWCQNWCQLEAFGTGLWCSALFSQRCQQLLCEIEHRLLIEADVIKIGQDVALRDRDRCRLSLDQHDLSEVLALLDDTQPVAVSVMWSSIVFVWRLVFQMWPLFNQGKRLELDCPNFTGVLYHFSLCLRQTHL